MKFKRYDKRYLPMLWIGLAIWAVGFGVTWLLESLGIKLDSQGSLVGMSKWVFQSSPTQMLLMLCIVGPILEEFSFRLWGVGKRWTTIICLVLMAIFCFSEISFWGLLFVVGIVLALLLIKDSFKRNWVVTLLSSAAFALCHISGFSGFSLGMVLGLIDIFGSAIVMCWLTINLSIWFSCLLHMCSNSLSILLPLLFVGSPIHNEYNEGEIKCTTTLEAIHPFADNDELLNNYAYSFYPIHPQKELICVGEPQEIVAMLLNADTNFTFHSSPRYAVYSQPKGESIEERLVWTVRYDSAQLPDYHNLLPLFLKDYEAFANEKITFDTNEVDLEEVWLLSAEGEEVLMTDTTKNAWQYMYQYNISSYGMADHEFIPPTDTLCRIVYAYKVDGPVFNRPAQKKSDKNNLFGYHLTFRPSGKKIKLITIK